MNPKALLAATDSNTKVIWICSPNNPTGNDFPREVLHEVLMSFEGIVVIDEAYSDFSTQQPFRTVLDNYPNLIVLNTFSKAWASAAIRLGMAFASEEIIALFNKVKYPYNVNVLTQRAALSLLADYSRITAWVSETKAERARLIALLEAHPECLHIYPTDANFVLVRMTDAPAMYNRLLAQGIIVRNRHHVQLCQNCLRITVGTPEEDDALLAAMR